MNILLYDMGSYTQDDLIYYLRKAGHKCKNITYRIKNAFEDSFFEYRFDFFRLCESIPLNDPCLSVM